MTIEVPGQGTAINQQYKITSLSGICCGGLDLSQTFFRFDAAASWTIILTRIFTPDAFGVLAVVTAVVDLFSRPCGWLVDERADDGPDRHRRPADGDLAGGKPDALLHHYDRGSQYTSEQFQRLMADHGVVCSMSG